MSSSMFQPMSSVVAHAVERQSALPFKKMLLSAAIVVAAGVAAYPYLPRYYTSYANLVIRPTTQTGETTYTQTAHDSLDDNAIQTKIDILESPPLQKIVLRQNYLLNDPEIASHHSPYVQRVVDMLHPPSGDAEGEAIAKLSKMLTVKREKHSYVLQVSYESADPTKSAQLTNTLVNAFIADGIERKHQLYQSGLNSQKQKIATLQAEYTAAESVEHAFLVDSGLIHRTEIESLHRQLATLSDALASAHAKAFEAAAHYAALVEAQRTGSLDSVNEALSSPLLERLRERLIGLSTGTAQTNIGSMTGANETVIRNLQQSIGGELARILKAAKVNAQMTETVENSLKDEIANLDARLTTLQASERKLEVLDQRLTAARTALNNALVTYNNDSNKQFQADVEVVSAAVPSIRPMFPNIPVYFGGVLVMAVLSAGLFALPRIMKQR